MTEEIKNQIQIDDLDEYGDGEYLPEDAPMVREINAKLQEEVDALMDGLREENEINRRTTRAAINQLRHSALIMRSAGVRVAEPQVDEARLFDPPSDAELIEE